MTIYTQAKELLKAGQYYQAWELAKTDCTLATGITSGYWIDKTLAAIKAEDLQNQVNQEFYNYN